MRKHSQIHTLGPLHYKAHFRFLRKLKDFKCALRSEKCGNTNQVKQITHLKFVVFFPVKICKLQFTIWVRSLVYGNQNTSGKN